MDDAFFRAAFEADAANRARQSWDEYRGWVERFYEGQRFPPVPGWRKRAEELARAHPARGDLRAQLEATGRALAAEWAKDNAVRRVSTADLQAWAKRFEASARDADGLLALLREVEGRSSRVG